MQWTEGDQTSMLKRAIWVCCLKCRRRSLHLPITLFACDESVGRWGSTLGWHEAIENDFEVFRVPGTHNTFFEDAGGSRIIEVVERRCSEVDANATVGATQ